MCDIIPLTNWQLNLSKKNYNLFFRKEKKMLYLTEKDKLTINNCYHNFLQSLKENLQNKNCLDCYSIIIKLLKNGQFSFNNEIKYSSSFAYLNLPDMRQGAQVMYGIGCCRHINLLINDIMQTLGFNSTLLYVKVDNTDTWHKATPLTANHVVVTLKDNNTEYLLDAYNNFVFKIIGHDLDPIKLKNIDDVLINKYPDNNVKEIGLVLKKYYKLQELGIDHKYDYGY